MKDVHITTNSWIPLGAAVSVLTFIVAAAMWAKQIENKADNALVFQHKYEMSIDKRLENIERKLDEALKK